MTRPVLLTLLISIGISLSSPTAARADRAKKLKAAFVYNFMKFVDWPDELASANTPLRLCFVGRDPNTGLEQLAGKTVRGRLIRTEKVSSVGRVKACHVLVVSRGVLESQYLNAAKQGNVLTVSDVVGFTKRGGVIELFQDRGRYRFKISMDATHAAHLHLRSQLLKLAEIVD